MNEANPRPGEAAARAAGIHAPSHVTGHGDFSEPVCPKPSFKSDDEGQPQGTDTGCRSDRTRP